MDDLSDPIRLPPSQMPAESAWLRAARVCVLLAGVALVMTGLLSGALYIVAWLFAPVMANGAPNGLYAVAFAILALDLLFGAGLVNQAVSSLQGRPSRSFWLPAAPVALIVLLLAVVLGSVAPLSGPAVGLLFPIAYLLGIGTPILVVLSIVHPALARRGHTSRWRDVILQASSGAFLATGTALLIEAVVLSAFVVIAILVINARPGGAEMLQDLLRSIEPATTTRAIAMQEVISSPAILLAALCLLSVVVPLIEELFKAIGVLLFAYRLPTARDALWWGLLGGAGFALTEGVLNGSMAIGEYPWGMLVLLRAGTTLIHCCTSALVGLGWYSLLRGHGVGAWLQRYGLAVALHGVWNALSLGLVALPTGDLLDAPRSLAGLVIIILLACELAAIVLLLYRLIVAHYRPDEAPSPA